jgi:hypothetical protein
LNVENQTIALVRGWKSDFTLLIRW